MHLSRNFHRTELECPCCNHWPDTLDSRKFIVALQAIRGQMNIAFKINSGFRCNAYNRKIKGDRHSKHKIGTAVDISTLGWSAVCKHSFIEKATSYRSPDSKYTGVGIYQNHIHFDFPRKQKSLWWGEYS